MFNIVRKIAIMLFPELDLKILQKWGLRLGKNTYIGSSLGIDHKYCWLISIGDNCIISPFVSILAHDASSERSLGFCRLGRISLGSNVFVGINSIIFPNVKIGDNVIIGAGSVVTHDIPSDCVVAGNPASVIKSTSEFMQKHKMGIDKLPIYINERNLSWIEEIKKSVKKVALEKPYYVKC